MAAGRATIAVIGPPEISADVRDALQPEIRAIARSWTSNADEPHSLDIGVDAVLLVVRGDELIDRVPAARRRIGVPLLVMTLDAPASARAQALDLGADDALCPTWGDDEVRARLRAALRRSGGAGRIPAMRIGDLEIDLAAQTVRRDGRPIHLAPAEFALLTVLARAGGAVVPRETLAREVWEDLASMDDGRLHTTISTLRSKVDRATTRPLIRTIHRVGYALRG